MLSSVLIAFLLLRNSETVLVVNNVSAHTAVIFNCCQCKRGVAKTWTLVTRVELDLIVQSVLRPFGKHAISDVPQATKSVQFGKKLRAFL